ncbi:MAG: hypothetical protein ACLP5H_27670 [Desulfomonilaceae bacterium]
MTDLFDEREMGGVPLKDAPSTCCQTSGGNASSCCNLESVSQSRGKMLISAIIIVAAFGVAASSFVRVTSAQSGKTGPARSFSATLGEKPAAPEVDLEVKLPSQREDISFNRPLDSLRALDTAASDKDVVFIVLFGEGQEPPKVAPRHIAELLNNLKSSGQKIGAFTLNANVPDYGYLVRHFAVKSFPCVVVLGRGGNASAVSGDISAARLYNAFVLASKPATCCPTSSTAACCPK